MMSNNMIRANKIIVLGASGYIGSKLIEKLLLLGYSVNAVGRSIDRLKSYLWAYSKNVVLSEVDILDKAQVEKVCVGYDTLFYLVHSMDKGTKDFEEADRRAAKNIVEVAKEQKLKRIIYLGGLGEDEPDLSKHLRSRQEVSRILHSGSVPVTTLKAAMIIGKGSVSYEILRHLVHRLPIMITPRWVATQSQPIAIENVLRYLTGCLEQEETKGQSYDIGGPDILSYRELMEIYAQEKGLMKRIIIPVPVLTPRLSSYWINLVTPYPAYIARPLAEGLRNRVVCKENRIREIIPQKLIDCRSAIRLAIDECDRSGKGKRNEAMVTAS